MSSKLNVNTIESATGSTVTIASPVITNPAMSDTWGTLSYIAGGYQWDSWSPSDVSGTGTNSPATGTTNAATKYMSIANSSGTITITFTKAGTYLITVSTRASHANAYSVSQISSILGGTATRRKSTNYITNNGQNDIDSDNSASETFLVEATVGQTLTVLHTLYLTGDGTTAQHVATAQMTVLFVGNAA
jgi:hypothetical protein